MTAWLLLALSLVLIAICGLFVAAEFSLLAVDRTAVQRAADAGDPRAPGVLAALRTLSTQLSGVQLAITVTNLAVGFLSEPALASLLEGPLGSLGLSDDAVSGVAVFIGLIVSTMATMLLGELVPKNLAIALPLPVARVVTRPVRQFTRFARVPIRLLNRLADSVLSVVGVQAHEELASARSPEELVSLVRHSAEEGTLPARTATLLVRSLTFGDKRARDVLTPRPRVVTLAGTASVADLIDAVRRSGRSRLPITGPDGLDEVLGVVEIDQAVAIPRPLRVSTLVTAVMTPAVEVPEALPLDDVLRVLQEQNSQLAVVIDEYGGTAGLLTGEDLLEELVGDVEDEHDQPAPPGRPIEGGWDLSGLLRPDEVAALTGFELPQHGHYETIGGLLMHQLGRVPVVGDRLDVDGGRLIIRAMDGRRVDRVELVITDPSEEVDL